MESKAIARYARIAPRKARVVVNLVRGQSVAKALDVLAYTRRSGAPIVKKLIESALANAKQADQNLDVDTLYVTAGAVDKGPNKHLRRWRPRAMGRATQIVKGVSHIQILLTDKAPEPRPGKVRGAGPRAAKAAAKAEAASSAAAAKSGSSAKTETATAE
jgi:large subunit ribosomal protein L22